MQQIGVYEVGEVLARGGSGVIFRARDTRLGREVVLKLLKFDDPRSQERLKREARAMSRLVHPHVVPLLDAGEHAGEPYLVLPLLEGESLQDRLDRGGPLPVDEAVRAVSQVGQGLEAVHALGLVHRDLKPANVLRDTRGNALLTDFGLVKDVGPGQSQALSLSVKGQFIGTPGFWPPEQARGRIDEIGPAADVYGLGATLYALLSGRPPRDGENVYQLLRAFEQPVQPLVRFRDDVPLWVEDVVQRCLLVDPGDRPSLSDVLSALEEGAKRAGVAPLTAAQRARIGLSGAALAIGTGLVAWWIFGSPRKDPPPPKPPPAVEPAPTQQPPAPPVEPPAEPSPAEQARELVARGDELAAAGKHGSARDTYGEAVTLDAENVAAHSGLGWAQYQLANYAEAVDSLSDALALEPADEVTTERYARAAEKLARTHAERGDAALHRQEFEEALAASEEALELAPELAFALRNRGIAKFNLRRYDEALADLDRALDLAPKDASAWTARGRCKYTLGEVDEAAADFERALELDPNSAVALAGRGAYHYGNKRYEQALADCARAAEIDPQNHFAAGMAGRAAFALGKHADAQTHLDAALLLQPGDAEALLLRASCKLNLGQDAVADLDAADEAGVPEHLRDWAQQLREAAVPTNK